MKRQEEKGITIVALVVTIIVLLILAGIVFTFLLGDNGLIKRAGDAIKSHEISRILEKLELEKGNVLIDNGEKVTIEKYLEHLINKGIINREEIEETGEEKSKLITVEDKYIYLVEEEENGNIKITYEGEVGNLKPIIEIEVKEITTNSIKIKVNGKRIEKGEYRYYIKDVETGEEYKLKESSNKEEYIFEGLIKGKDYRIKVEGINKEGKTEKETGIIRLVELGDLIEEEISFIYNPKGWTNKEVIVTANVKKEIAGGCRIETSKDGVNWEENTSQVFEENGEMYVRISDGINESNYVVGEVTKIDKEKPEITEVTAVQTEVTIKGKDSKSGIIGYAVVANNIEPTRFTECSNTKELNIKVTGLTANTTYYIFIKDEAGNISESKQITTLEHTRPKVVAKNIDTSNLTRKTNMGLSELFEVTWGSGGTGIITYETTGNLLFKNQNLGHSIYDLSQLELGTYSVKCIVYPPDNNNIIITATKEVRITKLAQTTVTNESNQNVEAKAIYSEYDLAYFRDLVNKGENTLNGKVMNNINLTNVCSSNSSLGNWIPIGNINIKYNGIFDGDSKIIDKIYINTTENNQGMFGYLGTGTVKNIVIGNNSSIKGQSRVGAVIGDVETGKVLNCVNNGRVVANNTCGGILCGTSGTVENCINNGTVESIQNRAAGVVCINNGIVTKCKNTGNITSQDNTINSTTVDQATGGITAINRGIISNSSNTGNITVTKGRGAGGIVGSSQEGSTIDSCYNYNSIIKANGNGAAGISGFVYGTTMTNCYNYLSSNDYYIISEHNLSGGIVGRSQDGTAKTVIENCYNIGENINATSSGAILGGNFSTNIEIKNCYILNTTGIKAVGAENITIKTKQITKKTDVLFKTTVTNSTSVAYLLNGARTTGKWKQSSSINNGYPYLIDNIP